MKKILLFALLILGATFSQAQDSSYLTDDYTKKLAVNEMKTFVRILSLNDSGVVLNKNQTVKLERVFLIKNKEVVELRKQELNKSEYVAAHAIIDTKYEADIKSILSSDQRVAWEKNKKKSK